MENEHSIIVPVSEGNNGIDITGSITYDKCKALDFKIGDLFHEMFSIWICVINITSDNKIVTFEGHPANVFNMSIKKQTHEELFNRLKYSTLDACWVTFSKNDPKKVIEWFEHYKNEMKKSNDKQRNRDLDLELMLNELS